MGVVGGEEEEEEEEEEEDWLTARSGPATHPANRDLEGVRNASPPDFLFLFLFFLKKFRRKFETIHPKTAGFYVRNYIYSFGFNTLLPIHSHLYLNSVSSLHSNLSDPIPRPGANQHLACAYRCAPLPQAVEE